MEPAQARSIWLAVGGGAIVLVLAAGLGFLILMRERPTGQPPPASTGGLVVQSAPTPETRLDPTKPLRCFVNGQYVGDETLSDCARRNGVATGALDVGVDQTGQAAAGQAGPAITPLPPAAAAAPPEPAATSSAPTAVAATGACLRYAGQTWKLAGEGMSLSGCVRLLFDGHCQKPGGAAYGRWGAQTLRLLPGAVEISSDNRNFRPLVEQSAGCAIADFQG